MTTDPTEPAGPEPTVELRDGWTSWTLNSLRHHLREQLGLERHARVKRARANERGHANAAEGWAIVEDCHRRAARVFQAQIMALVEERKAARCSDVRVSSPNAKVIR